MELTPKVQERHSRIVAAQLRFQQRKLVRRALERSGIPAHQVAALRAEALRLLRLPMSELNKLMVGEDPALAARLVKG